MEDGDESLSHSESLDSAESEAEYGYNSEAKSEFYGSECDEDEGEKPYARRSALQRNHAWKSQNISDLVRYIFSTFASILLI